MKISTQPSYEIGIESDFHKLRKELQALHNMVRHDRRSQMLRETFMLRSINLKLELLLKHANIPKEEMMGLESALKENNIELKAACEQNRKMYEELRGLSGESLK